MCYLLSHTLREKKVLSMLHLFTLGTLFPTGAPALKQERFAPDAQYTRRAKALARFAPSATKMGTLMRGMSPIMASAVLASVEWLHPDCSAHYSSGRYREKFKVFICFLLFLPISRYEKVVE